MLRIYVYKGCGTCRKAIKWLNEREIEYESVAIRETPPSEEEFRMALEEGGGVKRLFNTSGVDYRAEGLKDILPTLDDNEAISLLQGNGNLVKRPFVVFGEGVLVGFKEVEWAERLLIK